MNRWIWWMAIAALVALTAWAYLPVLANGLVWDDWTNLAGDAPFAGNPSQLVSRAFTDVRLGHWQPVAWLSFGLDRALWGQDLRGYHAMNVLLHLANAVLFAVAAKRLFEWAKPAGQAASWAPAAALIATAVFAVHPLRVETVAWLTERRHLLSALFFLSASIVWLGAFDRTDRARPRLGALVASCACYALSLLSTPLGIALPVVLLVLDVWPLGRWRPRDGARRALSLVVEKLPFFVLALAFTVTALAAQRASDALIPSDRYNVMQRIAQAAYGALFYPRAIAATSWSPLYERPPGLDPFSPRFVLAMAGFVVVTVVVILVRKRVPALAAAWLAYLALLAPVSGLAQAGIQLVADRYSYLAGLPLVLLIAAALTPVVLDRRARLASAATTLALFGLLAWWSLATRAQVPVWRDDATLWTHVASRAPSAMAEGHLALLEAQAGRLGPALDHATRSVEIAPAFGRSWRVMIAVLERQGIQSETERLAVAADTLEQHMAAQDDHPLAWYALGLARAAGPEPASAVPALERAVEADPSMASAWRALVHSNGSAGRRSEALAALERGLLAVPNDPVLLELRRLTGGQRQPAAASP